jgi:hypothetical protein
LKLQSIFRDGRSHWPKAENSVDAHYQLLALAMNYITEDRKGFLLTDLGSQETKIPISRSKIQ